MPLDNATDCVLVGDPTFRNRLHTNHSLKYVHRVQQELAKRKRPCTVHKRFGKNADDDLALLVSSAVFVPSMKSSYSVLASKCREPRYHEQNPQLNPLASAEVASKSTLRLPTHDARNGKIS